MRPTHDAEGVPYLTSARLAADVAGDERARREAWTVTQTFERETGRAFRAEWLPQLAGLLRGDSDYSARGALSGETLAWLIQRQTRMMPGLRDPWRMLLITVRFADSPGDASGRPMGLLLAQATLAGHDEPAPDEPIPALGE